jgi:predicted transcriptional regulator YheO
MIYPRTPRERRLILQTLGHVVEGLARALGGNVEVVLHDLSKPGSSVAAIANGQITGRTVGSAIISGPFDDLGLKKLIAGDGRARGETHSIVSGYRTRARNGHELDSTSLLLRDDSGRAYAALCVNVDQSQLRQAQDLLAGLLVQDRDPGTADMSEPPSIDSLVQEIIEDGIRASGKPVAAMTKDDKKQALCHMSRRGLFLIRSSVDIVAGKLGVSRFTIYNYLDELKRGSDIDGEEDLQRRRKA